MSCLSKPERADSRQYDEWLDKAGGDLLCARALQENDRCYDGAGFHCQQAVEKALKAYLLLRGGQLYEGHSLTWLCRRALRYDRRFAQWFEESAALTHCYIETRYPSDLYEPFDFVRVREAYGMAHDMYLFICRQIDAHFSRAPRQPEQEP